MTEFKTTMMESCLECELFATVQVNVTIPEAPSGFRVRSIKLFDGKTCLSEQRVFSEQENVLMSHSCVRGSNSQHRFKYRICADFEKIEIETDDEDEDEDEDDSFNEMD